MWDEVDQIQWKRLKHNYGNASDVPTWLRGCADEDADVAGNALDDLDMSVFHQGGWICPAAAATLPRMVDHRSVRELGELGTLAAAAAGRLRELTASGDGWTRTEAALAHYRVTGDPSAAVPVLTEVAGPLAEGRCLPVMITALEHLAVIGGPPAAPIARAVLDSPRRLSSSGGWHAFADDERVRAAAARLYPPATQ